MAAAVAVVTERGTADVPVSDIAEAADVSRRLVYQQFGDRDTLLLEAALDLARRELLPRLAEGHSGGNGMLTIAQHMADHRPFYRALLTSPCAFALTKELNSLLLPVNREGVRQMHGKRLDASTMDDLAAFLTGGWGAFVLAWVVEGPEPLDPEQFAGRLLRIAVELMPEGWLPSSTPDGTADGG